MGRLMGESRGRALEEGGAETGLRHVFCLLFSA